MLVIYAKPVKYVFHFSLLLLPPLLLLLLLLLYHQTKSGLRGLLLRDLRGIRQQLTQKPHPPPAAPDSIRELRQTPASQLASLHSSSGSQRQRCGGSGDKYV